MFGGYVVGVDPVDGEGVRLDIFGASDIVSAKEYVENFNNITHPNLCDSCKFEFATCSGNPLFAVDKFTNVAKKFSDSVVQCDKYTKK